jgi:hypothetical protein
MTQPERRKTTTIQRISLGLNAAELIAICSLAYAYGQQSQDVKTQGEELTQQREANAAARQAISSAIARVDVIENKGEATQLLLRDLKMDLNERLRRIEDKLDSGRNRR